MRLASRTRGGSLARPSGRYANQNNDSTDRKARIVAALRDPALLGLVGLRRTPTGWVARCPLHDDHTPSLSFTDRADRTTWYCFGACGGGDMLDLLARMRGLSVNSDFSKVLDLAEAIAGGGAISSRSGLDARRAPKQADRLPPPAAELTALYDHGVPVSDDLACAAWLASRRLDAATIVDRDLARALPTRGEVPGWARGWPASGHRLLVRTFDARGEIVSLQARSILGRQPKALWPSGHRASGIFADELARSILRDGPPKWWRARSVHVAEGIPDFLSFATCFGDAAAEDAQAVIGMVGGTWSQAIADRLRVGLSIRIHTHADAAGTRYRGEIRRSLGLGEV